VSRARDPLHPSGLPPARRRDGMPNHPRPECGSCPSGRNPYISSTVPDPGFPGTGFCGAPGIPFAVCVMATATPATRDPAMDTQTMTSTSRAGSDLPGSCLGYTILISSFPGGMKRPVLCNKPGEKTMPIFTGRNCRSSFMTDDRFCRDYSTISLDLFYIFK
jgi:hypothetical protein